MHKFESGYNGAPWSFRKSPEDVFYCELDSCTSSKSFGYELGQAFKQKDLSLIHDGSLVAQAVAPFFSKDQLVIFDEVAIDLKFAEEIKEKYHITNSIDLKFLSICQAIKKPICLPLSSGRIFNFNFRRSSQIEIGTPYFVFAEPERFHNLKVVAKDYQLSIIVDILKITSEVFRSYILHDLHQEIYRAQSFPFPHNDLIERRIWANLNPLIGNLYPKPESTQPEMGVMTYFPLHGLLSKYFHYESHLNAKEQEYYGTAY